MTADRIAVEASCVGSQCVASIVKIGGEAKDGVLNRYFELLLPCAHCRKVRQFTGFETQLLDDILHFVKDIKESPVWKVTVFAESVDRNGHPVRVSTVTLLDWREAY